jgi:hypothetical protein
MKQDPLIIYRSLIPGGLHNTPGGLNPPRERRMRNESSQPDCPSGADGTAQFAKKLRHFTVSLRKTLTAFCKFTVAVPMNPISARQSGLWAPLVGFRRVFHGSKRPAGPNSQCLHGSRPPP